jgi:hypothetical protein
VRKEQQAAVSGASASTLAQGIDTSSPSVGDDAVEVVEIGREAAQSRVAKKLFVEDAAALRGSPLEDTSSEAQLETGAEAVTHGACILHMDSLGMHGSVAIGKRLRR